MHEWGHTNSYELSTPCTHKCMFVTVDERFQAAHAVPSMCVGKQNQDMSLFLSVFEMGVRINVPSALLVPSY